MGLAYYVSNTVYIMEKGKFVEHGSADEVILNPRADYTKQLLSDVPKIHDPWEFSRNRRKETWPEGIIEDAVKA
jgi:peptide/nickel transport system ATP-binding protein